MPPDKVRPPVDESGGREDERLAGGRSVGILAHDPDTIVEACRRLRRRWAKDIAGAADLLLLDPAQVRAVTEDDEAGLAIATIRGVAQRWADQLEQAAAPAPAPVRSGRGR